MNLINNEDGTWDQTKTNLHQDLTNIQANINQILAKINAIPDPVIQPAAVIAPSNQVTIPKGVFTKHLGALSGNGLVANPLGVNVDGTTITVNGSNQLTASSTPTPSVVFFAGVQLTSADILSMAGGTPFKLLSGFPQHVIHPLVVISETITQSTPGFAFQTSGTLIYGNSSTNTAITASFPIAYTAANPGIHIGLGVGLSFSPVNSADPNYPLGADVYINDAAPNGAGLGDIAHVSMWYVLF